MIGLDTNVLLRYIVMDDEHQSARAVHIIESELSEENPGFVTLITFAEVIWTLSSRYKYTGAEQSKIIAAFLGSKRLLLQNQADIYRAYRLFGQDPGFLDVLTNSLCASAGCTAIKTFDRKASKFGLFELA